MITWSARNDSSFLNGERTAKTLAAAVRAARAYVNTELHGVGTLSICDNGEFVRSDTRNQWTNYKWQVTTPNSHN